MPPDNGRHMQAFWGEDKGGGRGSDLVAAIEDAIKDGADIISYSAGGSDDIGTFRTDVFMAFMNAGA
jgi:hypothetical protein